MSDLAHVPAYQTERVQKFQTLLFWSLAGVVMTLAAGLVFYWTNLTLGPLQGVALVFLAIVTLAFLFYAAFRHAFIQKTNALLDASAQLQWLTNRRGRLLTPSDGPEGVGARFSFSEAERATLLVQVQQEGSVVRSGMGREGRHRLEVRPLGLGIFVWTLSEALFGRAGETENALAHVPQVVLNGEGDVQFMNRAAHVLFAGRSQNFPDILENLEKPVFLDTKDGPTQCNVSCIDMPENYRALFLMPLSAALDSRDAIRFEALPVALLKLAPDGHVIVANKSARRLLGDENVIRRPLHDLMEGLGRSINDWLAEAAAGLGDSHTEFLVLKRSDREVFVQVSLSRIMVEDRVALMAVLTDATELKSLEAQFVQSQKMQAIGQLAGGVAHDFNNLLTAITGHCDLLLMRHDQSDPDYADLVQINQNANRAAALVGQLLAFSRKQNLRPEVLDLRDTLADLTHLLNRLVGERIHLTLCHDPALRSVRADKRQLEQVLMNLVVNARDAMPDGGEIVIETESLSLERAWKRDRATVPPGDYVCVKVKDQGIGIPSDKIQKVFEPFYTTKRTGEGTGLGLSTAYGIVKQTGGYIFVDSVIDQGTCFSLLFPVHEVYDVAGPALPSQKQEQIPLVEGGVILLVEDEAPVRSFACRALRLKGFTVLEAASGEEALETLEDASIGIDLFVSDVVMPGLDGPGWVTQAHENRPGTPVVFMSGYAEDSFSDTQARIPNTAFLQKPFSLNQLVESVQDMMVKH
ncbi:hybrid sensor histidine kinase/response regulator [Shimia thalassica]|uniref:hybrid sensor histidine kinase/response regulator n=1 Tax=Shimia thalassica TaxID=1715693 RepID=UPI0026E3FFDA|nr:ATP-binding protein [Shimia thalassica]MDO6483038.1 ATP-binding protein [Shimia thalassica]